MSSKKEQYIRMPNFQNFNSITEGYITILRDYNNGKITENEMRKYMDSVFNYLICVINEIVRNSIKNYPYYEDVNDAFFYGMFMRLREILYNFNEDVKRKIVSTHTLFYWHRSLFEVTTYLEYLIQSKNRSEAMSRLVKQNLKETYKQHQENKISEDSYNKILKRSHVSNEDLKYYIENKANNRNNELRSFKELVKHLKKSEKHIDYYSLPSAFIHNNWVSITSTYLDYDEEKNIFKLPEHDTILNPYLFFPKIVSEAVNVILLYKKELESNMYEDYIYVTELEDIFKMMKYIDSISEKLHPRIRIN